MRRTAIGQLKSLAKQKDGAKNIAEAIALRGTTTVSAHAYVGCVIQHEGVTGKGRDKYQVVFHI